MRKKIYTLFFLGVCLVSICSCGGEASSDNIGNVQDSSRVEEPVERTEKEEIKINKNVGGKQHVHEKRSEGDFTEEELQQADANMDFM